MAGSRRKRPAHETSLSSMKARRGPANRAALRILAFVLSIHTKLTLLPEQSQEAGGEILDKGEFCPGEPYLFFKDLDGYEVEIAFELPTPVDPKSKKK